MLLIKNILITLFINEKNNLIYRIINRKIVKLNIINELFFINFNCRLFFYVPSSTALDFAGKRRIAKIQKFLLQKNLKRKNRKLI